MVGHSKIIPLSKYLGTESPSFDKGYGIRKWKTIDNCEETFAEDFFDKIKAAVFKRYGNRKNENPKAGDSFNSKGNRNIVTNQADYDNVDGVNFQGSDEFHLKLHHERCSTPSTEMKTSRSRYESMSPVKTLELCELLWNSLNDDRPHVKIEGMYCSKKMLAEWATRYLKDSKLKEAKAKTVDVSAQTDFPEPLTLSVECQTEAVVPKLLEVSCGGGVDSLLGPGPVPYASHQNLRWNNPTNGTNPQTNYLSQTNQSLPFQAYQQVSSQPNQSSLYQQNPRINERRFYGAINWQPRSDDQTAAVEQAKLDLFNVLVVTKGLSYRHVIKQFLRIVQEPLDFHKMGIPDLRSLLVQMRDLMILKKHRFTGEYFVFPRLNNDKFENVSHIAELVAEQRDRDFVPLPHESTLMECDISELFEEEGPYYPSSSQFQTSHGFATNSNPQQFYYYNQQCLQNQLYYQNYVQYFQRVNAIACQNTNYRP